MLRARPTLAAAESRATNRRPRRASSLTSPTDRRTPRRPADSRCRPAAGLDTRPSATSTSPPRASLRAPGDAATWQASTVAAPREPPRARTTWHRGARVGACSDGAGQAARAEAVA